MAKDEMFRHQGPKASSMLLMMILALFVSALGVGFGAYSYGSTNRIDLERRITATETTCDYFGERLDRIDRKLDMVLERMSR